MWNKKRCSKGLSENYNRDEKMRNGEQIFGNLRRITAKQCQELFNDNSRKFGPIFFGFEVYVYLQ